MSREYECSDACLPWIDASRIQLDRSPVGLIHQSLHLKFRHGTLAGTTPPIVALCFRSTPVEDKLRSRTLQLLRSDVFHQPRDPVSVAGS